MLRIEQPALETALKHIEHRLPVDAGRLHPDQRHGEALQPLFQFLELRDRGAKRALVLLALAPTLPRHPHRRHHAVSVHIKTGATLNKDIHRLPPSVTVTSVAVRRDLPFKNLRYALEAAVDGSSRPRTTL
jgi:hypothetical protein